MGEQASNEIFDGINDDLAGETEPSTPDEKQVEPSLEGEQSTVSLETLKADLDKLSKANTGLRHALTEERNKRQTFEGRLQGISETFASALEKKQAAKEPEEPVEEPIPDKIPIDFDDDGSPFMKTQDILKLVKMRPADMENMSLPQLKKLESQVNQISSYFVQNQVSQVQRTEIDSLIRSNPEYPAQFQTLIGQWKQLNNMYDTYISENNLPVPGSLDDAVHQIVSGPVSKEFLKLNPNADLELLVEAFTTPNLKTQQRKLQKAMDNQLKITTKPDSNLEKQNLSTLSKKPTNLGKITNQSSGNADTTIERVAEMSLDDFLSLSDSDTAKIKSLLRKQE
jgi:hypothetical protein